MSVCHRHVPHCCYPHCSLTLTGFVYLGEAVNDGLQVRVVVIGDLQHDAQYRYAVIVLSSLGHAAVTRLVVHEVKLTWEPAQWWRSLSL